MSEEVAGGESSVETEPEKPGPFCLYHDDAPTKAVDVQAKTTREELIDKLEALDIDIDALRDFCRDSIIISNPLPHNAVEQRRAVETRLGDVVDELVKRGGSSYTIMLALRGQDQRLARREDDARKARAERAKAEKGILQATDRRVTGQIRDGEKQSP